MTDALAHDDETTGEALTLPTAATKALLASAAKLEAEASAVATVLKAVTATFRPPFCKGGPVNAQHIAHCPALHIPGDAL